MATVTGLTAEAMLAIRNGMVMSATFNSANHLILTKYDGTTIDAGTIGNATTAATGVVELATSAETQAGTDTVRAVTPAGLASIPGYKVQIVSGIAESATPASWPYATSLQAVSAGSGWTPNGGAGTIVTESIDSTRTAQIFYENSGGTASTKAWVREYNSSVGGGGWTAWAQMMLMVQLNAASFTQATTRGNYPAGLSRLYYTTATSSSWDFSGMAGEVVTYIEGTDFGRQTFTQHAGGSTNPVQWFRTATASGGWTAWQKVFVDTGAWVSWTPAWSSQGSVQPSIGNSTLNCRYFKIGRKVDCIFEVTFGSTANFGSSPTTGDNWQFSLPITAARTTDTLGFVEMSNNSNSLMSIARARMYSATGFRLGIATGRVDGVIATAPNGPNGDVDSLSPWTWVTGASLKGTFSYESAS